MKKILSLALALGLLATACTPPQEEKKEIEKIIGKHDIKLQSDIMTPEVLWSFGRLGDVQISPDGKTALYGVSYYDIPENKSNRELFTISVDGKNKKQLTQTAGGEYGAIWRPDGKKVVFLSAESGSMQAWEMDPDGSAKTQISNVDGDINNIIFSPKQDKVFFTMEVKIDDQVADIYPDLPKADGKLINDLMYRHWDSWEDGNYSHIFVAAYSDGKISNSYDIMKGEAFVGDNLVTEGEFMAQITKGQ